MYTKVLTLTSQRPSSSEPSPFSMINDNLKSVAAMKRAEAHPNVVLISDWDKYTSAEYTVAEQASNLDLLSVILLVMTSSFC